MTDDEQTVSGNIGIGGNVGAGATVGHGAKSKARDIAGRDMTKTEHHHHYAPGEKPKPIYSPPPLPARNELPTYGDLSPGSYLAHSPNPYFTGRERELKTLAQTLLYKAEGRDLIISQTAVASGLGGIGKTQLAVEFAHRYGRFFAGGVYWLNCATAESIPAEVAIIGGEQGMGLYRSSDNLTLDDQVGRVKQAWQEPVARLLIFDNCEEETILKAWRPVTGGCRVLVTSRQGQWAGTLAVTQVNLDVLTRPRSVALLRRFVPKVEDKDADSIADELGDLPLALHLAGSFLKRYDQVVAPPTYLAQLRNKRLLEHPSMQGRGAELSPTAHELNVGRTFTLSYSRLNPQNEIDKAALKLLACAACFAPGEAIPVDLMQVTVFADADESAADLLAEDGLNRLMMLGLLTQEGKTGYQLHRLLAMYVTEVLTLAMEQSRGQVEQAVIEKARKLNKAGYPAPLLTLQGQLRYVTERAVARESEWAGRLLNELGYHLNMIAEYAETRQCYELALAIKEQVLGADHPSTATSLNNLGMLLQETGDYKAARPYYERALAIDKKVLGADHPDTVIDLNNLGGLLYAMGDYTEAQVYLERALNIRERVLEADHPDIATSLNNLGYLLQTMGNRARAQLYYERALIIWERVLEPEHPHTATSLNNLGGLLKDIGDYEGAQPYLERALKIWEKVFGSNHPSTAASLNNLGRVLQETGDYAEAQSCYERALAIREQVLGPNHPLTANTLNNLGMLRQTMGDYVEAQGSLERALIICEKMLGPEHPDTAQSLNNLGELLDSMGNYVGARPYFQRALIIFEQVLGSHHPSAQTVRQNLGQLEVNISSRKN